MHLDRIHEPNIPIHRQENTADGYLGGYLGVYSKGSKRTSDRSETISIVNRKPVVHRKNDKARNLPSCQPTRKKSHGTVRTQHANSTPGSGIFKINPIRRHHYQEAYKGKTFTRNICGRFLWWGGDKITDGGTDDIWRTTSGMVQQEAGYSSAVDNGSGVYSRLRGSEGYVMGTTILQELSVSFEIPILKTDSEGAYNHEADISNTDITTSASKSNQRSWSYIPSRGKRIQPTS